MAKTGRPISLPDMLRDQTAKLEELKATVAILVFNAGGELLVTGETLQAFERLPKFTMSLGKDGRTGALVFRMLGEDGAIVGRPRRPLLIVP